MDHLYLYGDLYLTRFSHFRLHAMYLAVVSIACLLKAFASYKRFSCTYINSQ